MGAQVGESGGDAFATSWGEWGDQPTSQKRGNTAISMRPGSRTVSPNFPDSGGNVAKSVSSPSVTSVGVKGGSARGKEGGEQGSRPLATSTPAKAPATPGKSSVRNKINDGVLAEVSFPES